MIKITTGRATAPKINRHWHLVARPVGLLKESDFELRQSPVPTPSEGEVLIRNLYLSLDPAIRAWTSRDAYIPAVAIGEVMRGFVVGIVEHSRNTKFKNGTLVQGMLGWQDYALSDGMGLTILPKDPDIPLTAYFGLFGHIGLTAYFGLLDIGKPRPGETLVVSGAAGAVGSLVGQIGKVRGCRVVGVAGTQEKCRWLTNELGFDAAFSYKTDDVVNSLRKRCPNGIDIYFENVGGAILDAVLSLINIRARIVLCGLIAQYNASEAVPGPFNFINILDKRARVEGFILLDYMDRAQAVRRALADLRRWYTQSKLKYRVEVIDGLENAPRAVNRIFEGTHKGKLIIKI